MTVPATYRNGAFYPDAPVDLPDGTRAEIAVEAADDSNAEPYAFLKALEEANLDSVGDGADASAPEAPPSAPYAWMSVRLDQDLDLPPDFSENVNDYVSGRKTYKGRRFDGKDIG